MIPEPEVTAEQSHSGQAWPTEWQRWVEEAIEPSAATFSLVGPLPYKESCD